MTEVKQLATLGLFDAKVPRYTSYPTAPNFSTNVQTDSFSEWLTATQPGDQVSMYVHIPFCRRLCWFCACRTQGVTSDDPVLSYLATVVDEIRMIGMKLPAGVTLSRLHWGGGTPTLLGPDAVQMLANAIFDVLPLAKDAEFSVEIDPNEVDDARLNALAAVGMNRASIGVQDFDPKIQKTIGRDQSFAVTRDISDALRARGIHSLNMDVLYGLPHQDVPSIVETTKKVIELSPDRVALYGYAHVPWMARRQAMIPVELLPGGADRLALSDTARDLFTDAGYAAIGIDHFAKAEDGLAVAQRSARLRRNFQGYTDDPANTLIGVGASAISRFPQGYVQNVAGTSAYLGKIRAGCFASARGHAFDSDDILRARVIEELMCNFRVDIMAIETEVGKIATDIRREARQIQQKYSGFMNRFGDVLEITEKGQPLTRMIAQEFDAYNANPAGHSMAI